MHPRPATLVAFCDGELGSGRTRAIARHLVKCEHCRDQFTQLHATKNQLWAARTDTPEIENRDGLGGLLSAIDRWQRDPVTAGAPRLKAILRRQIEMYFGSACLSIAESPGMPAEDFLRRAGDMLDVFLGETAAEAARDEVFAGLAYLRSEDWR
jgi:hypothetical protein